MSQRIGHVARCIALARAEACTKPPVRDKPHLVRKRKRLVKWKAKRFARDVDRHDVAACLKGWRERESAR